MGRPAVYLDNYEAIYDYYKSSRQSSRLSALAIKLAGKGLDTHFSFDTGVEDAITGAIADDRRLVFVSHHVSHKDPQALVQLSRQHDSLRGLQSNTFVGAMHSVFQVNPIKRRVIDSLGAVPFMRPKDFTMSNRQIRPLVTAASVRFVDTAIHKINNGGNMAIFPGAERAKDPLVVPDFRSGILGRIVCGLEKSALLVPVGIAYADYKDGESEKIPYIHLGGVLDQSFTRKSEVGDAMHPLVQAAVFVAHAHANTHEYGLPHIETMR